MAAVSAALFALPILGYVVGSIFAAYAAVCAHGYIRQSRSPPVALPRPVNESAAKKSTFSFIMGSWNWRKWTTFPWSYSLASIPRRKATSIAVARNLSVELLPTTGLPPPPTSIPSPAPTPQLVDLGTPDPAKATATSGFSSFPSSPRLPSRLLLQPARSPKTIQHLSVSRPPSPHTLLATTPPPKQGRRSRSLGGVPVRRLSGGPSGLRHAFDVEMKEFSPGHTRGESQEGLLIDFSDDDEQRRTDARISPSPAASDIGVMPVSNPHVKPLPMPLVDLDSDSTDVHKKLDSKEASWMWLGPSTPSIIKSYGARGLLPHSTVTPFSGEIKFAFPTPLPFPKTERLVDVPSSPDEKLEMVAGNFSKPLVDLESDLKSQMLRNAACVEVDLPNAVIDPFADDVETSGHARADLLDDDPDGGDPSPDMSSSIQPLLKLSIGEETGVRANSGPFTYSQRPRVAVESMPSSSRQSLLFAETELYSSSEATNDTPDQNNDLGSPWVSVDSGLPSELARTIVEHTNTVLALPFKAEDPWGDHIPFMHSGVLAEVAEDTCMVHTTDVVMDDGNLVESSPGGSLFPTFPEGDAADEQVPEFNLDDPSMEVVQGKFEEEGDDTPRPTPAPGFVPLPTVDETSVPVIIVRDNSLLAMVNEQEVSGNTLEADSYPDPDLLPLPEFPPVTSDLLAESDESTSMVDCEEVCMVPRPPSQMPTPPASPPAISPIRLAPSTPNLRSVSSSLPSSPHARSRHLAVSGSLTKSRSLPRPTSPFPYDHEDENDNSMPIALPQPLCDVEQSKKAQLERESNPKAKSREEPMEILDIDEDVASKDPVASIPSSLQDNAPPGAFPDDIGRSTTTSSVLIKSGETTSSTPHPTVAARLVSAGVLAPFHPSVRAIVRQPVEIALAMQLRPGLGAGADPAWMVRFLMAMFGWFAVLVSGQENY